MPGRAKRYSTMIVEPISRPRLMPISVTSENDEGRSASLKRMCIVPMPLAFAARMKSSLRVPIRSLRRTRVNIACIPPTGSQTPMQPNVSPW